MLLLNPGNVLDVLNMLPEFCLDVDVGPPEVLQGALQRVDATTGVHPGIYKSSKNQKILPIHDQLCIFLTRINDSLCVVQCIVCTPYKQPVIAC